MKVRATVWLFLFGFFAACSVLSIRGESQAQKTDGQTSASAATDEERKNIQEYIELLRENLREEKAVILGSVMQFTPDQSAQFWPIYQDYEAELTKLNDRKVENIKNYARDYRQMTDEKADQLTMETLDFQRERAELLAKYYERVKQSLGATTAARFLRVENQLLSIIDLQIDCKLPITGQRA